MDLKVFSSTFPTECYIVQGLLQSAGIDCQVRGDGISSIYGEVPISEDTAVTVVIERLSDQQHALKLISEYESAKHRPSWKCAKCLEDNDGAFDFCWQCGKAAS